MILNVGKCVETFAYKIQQICDGIGEEGVLRIGRTKILTIVCSICQVTHNLFFFDLSIKIMLWYHWSWGVSCCDYYACFLGIQSSDITRFRWFSWFIRACLTNKNQNLMIQSQKVAKKSVLTRVKLFRLVCLSYVKNSCIDDVRDVRSKRKKKSGNAKFAGIRIRTL